MPLTVQKDILGRDIWVDPAGKVYTGGGSTPTAYDVTGWNERQQEQQTKGAPTTVSTQSTTGQPTIDLNAMYQTSMNDPALVSLQSEIDTKKVALTTAMSNINDNPWYSEATRVGKLSKLQTQANSEMAVLTDQLAQKKADVQVKLNIATQQYNIDSSQYQNNLSKLNMLISSGGLTNASGSDLAQIALATGISTSMLNSMQEKIKQEAIKPQVLTNTDDVGNVTVSIIDTGTGKVISQNSLGQLGKATKPTKDTTDADMKKDFYSAISDGIDQLQKGEDWGTVWNRIKTRFPEILDEVIDNMLGATQWREAGAYQAYAKSQAAGKVAPNSLGI